MQDWSQRTPDYLYLAEGEYVVSYTGEDGGDHELWEMCRSGWGQARLIASYRSVATGWLDFPDADSTYLARPVSPATILAVSIAVPAPVWLAQREGRK